MNEIEQIIYDIILYARFKGAKDSEILDTKNPIIKFSDVKRILEEHGKDINQKPYSTILDLVTKRPDVALTVYKRNQASIKPKYKIIKNIQTYSVRKGGSQKIIMLINNISESEALLFMSINYPGVKNFNGTYNVPAMLSASVNIINQSTGEKLK